MGISFYGRIARDLTSRKRPRYVYNIFFTIVILVFICATCILTYHSCCDYICYDVEQIYLKHENGYLITDAGNFELAPSDIQEINISTLTKAVDKGDKITLTISSISGELLEVKSAGKTVYKGNVYSIATIIMSAMLMITLLGLCIFSLVVINIKNPGKRIDKWQRQILLRFYK